MAFEYENVGQIHGARINLFICVVYYYCFYNVPDTVFVSRKLIILFKENKERENKEIV